MLLSHNFQKSHCLTTQTLIPVHNPFRSGEENVVPSLTVPRRSIQRNLRLRRAPNGVKALLTSTKKSTSVKVVITVIETVGGVLSHLGLSEGLDGVADLLGRSLLVELVPAEVDASK